MWRREWDSNPRWVAPHTLSKRADSAALASLRVLADTRRTRRRRPGDLRHTAGSAESCCLPALTRFTACSCTGPGRHLRVRPARVAGLLRTRPVRYRLAGRAVGRRSIGSAPMAYQSLYRRYRPRRFGEVGARSTSSAPCATPCARTGSATPTCSAGPAARARPRPPASWPRRSTASTRSTASRAACASRASPIEAGTSLRRPRARRGVEQRRRDDPRPHRAGRARHAGPHEGVHPRRGPHAVDRRRRTRC